MSILKVSIHSRYVFSKFDGFIASSQLFLKASIFKMSMLILSACIRSALFILQRDITINTAMHYTEIFRAIKIENYLLKSFDTSTKFNFKRAAS